jgi:ABC-2 type transport system permease protein
VITDFKLKYQGSILGYMWSLLRPLAVFVVLYVVFVKFLKVGHGVPHYPIYLLLGIVLWNFFSDITNGAVGSIVSRGDLIRKISFPKYVIVLSTSINALINLGINLIIIFVFMLIFGTDASPWAILALPIAIIEIYVVGLGIGFFLSAFFVKFRDVSYIWEVIMQAAFYATPILYPLSIMPTYAQKILIMNPVAESIQQARYYLVTPQTVTATTLFDNILVIVPTVLIIVIFIFGALYFKKVSKSFAENI